MRFAPIMGVTRVANVTGLDGIGIPVVMVCRPNSRSVSVSQGKGVDILAARASGLMEAAELYHAETITIPLYLASYEELRYKHVVAEPRQLARDARSRFSPNLRLLWAEGRDLLSDDPVLVPYETVHTNYTIPPPDGYGCFSATSNGLASGNHLLEAISHGLCEVIERDATTLWKLRSEERLDVGRLDLSSVDDPTCLQLLAKFDDAGVTVGVWDITSEIPLPVFACFVLPREDSELWSSGRVAAGFGCHPARGIALARALTEAAQSRLTLIPGSRDDFGREVYAPCPDEPLLNALQGDTPLSTKRFCDAPNGGGDTLEADVEWELEGLKGAGFHQVIVINLTKDEFGIPVVRVVVPGLEGILVSGYVPGRRGRPIVEAQS